MDIKDIIKKHLEKTRVMQLATSLDDKPWACNIHYYTDEDLNFYWISTPNRRHSKEIEKNPNVAITVNIHEDTPDEQHVIGVSAEGTAGLMDKNDAKKIDMAYSKKLNKKDSLITNIRSGENPHRFYCMKPTRLVLFDNRTFPNNPKKEIDL